MSKLLKIGGKLLKKVAPTVATSLGGPLGGVALHILGEVLGIDNTDQSTILDFIERNQNPDLALKLKQAENEFKLHLKDIDVQMAELDFKHERMFVDDRISARDMQSKTKSRATAFIAGGVMLTFLIMVVALFKYPVPKEAAPVLYMLMGAIATAITQVMNFYFGSSQGSKSKDGQMSELIGYMQDMHKDDYEGGRIEVSQLGPALKRSGGG